MSSGKKNKQDDSAPAQDQNVKDTELHAGGGDEEGSSAMLRHCKAASSSARAQISAQAALNWDSSLKSSYMWLWRWTLLTSLYALLLFSGFADSSVFPADLPKESRKILIAISVLPFAIIIGLLFFITMLLCRTEERVNTIFFLLSALALIIVDFYMIWQLSPAILILLLGVIIALIACAICKVRRQMMSSFQRLRFREFLNVRKILLERGTVDDNVLTSLPQREKNQCLIRALLNFIWIFLAGLFISFIAFVPGVSLNHAVRIFTAPLTLHLVQTQPADEKKTYDITQKQAPESSSEHQASPQADNSATPDETQP